MLTYNGYIEEYRVRDHTMGDDWIFRDFDEACKYLEGRRTDYPDNAISLIAVLDGG